MSYQTNQSPIASLVDVLAELEKSIVYFLQNPSSSEGLAPDEAVPQLEAPVASMTDVKFFLGESEKYAHTSRPYAVWTLGDTRQEGGQARGSGGLDPVSPRPFKKVLDLIQFTAYGASLDGLIGIDPSAPPDHWKRGTIRGCEILRWAYYWALREHWGGQPRFERETWIEVSGNNQTGYAWQSSFRVPMSQMRPNNLTMDTQPLDTTLERGPVPRYFHALRKP